MSSLTLQWFSGPYEHSAYLGLRPNSWHIKSNGMFLRLVPCGAWTDASHIKTGELEMRKMEKLKPKKKTGKIEVGKSKNNRI